MTASEWAAWVQAIGSILAIGIAIYAAHKQAIGSVQSQNRLFRHEKLRRYAALRGLIEALVEELHSIIDKLDQSDPLQWFEENSARELIDEFRDAFRQVSPLEMPSAESARALVSLRDIVGMVAYNIKAALEHFPDGGEGYTQALEAIRSNYEEIKELQERLLIDLHKSINQHD